MVTKPQSPKQERLRQRLPKMAGVQQDATPAPREKRPLQWRQKVREIEAAREAIQGWREYAEMLMIISRRMPNPLNDQILRKVARLEEIASIIENSGVDESFVDSFASDIEEIAQVLAEMKSIKEDTTKANITIEKHPESADNPPTPDLAGTKAEGFLNNAIAAVLTGLGVPKAQHRETWAEMEAVARARADLARRPKWEERGKYAELKDLSAPKFLKRVYADKIAPDGSLEMQAVRVIDRKLMSLVEAYVSYRKRHKADLGEAAGLRLIAGPSSPLKAASLA